MTEKMKPSGIAWVGDIPHSWKCKKLKYLISEPLQYGANEEGCDFDETYPRYIRITDIEDNNQLKSDGKQSLLPSVAVPYMLNDGDVLFARSGATVGKTFIFSSEIGCAAFAGYLIRASVDKKQILPKYLYYCTINGGYDNWKNSVFTQATIQNIGADKYAQFSIAFPSVIEQQCIVDFLDAQCAKIDSVIADIEKQIETLQKYKISLITEAVTKGLDRSVVTKDSGVKWVGEIPATWKVSRVKYLIDDNHPYPIGDGDHGMIKADDYLDEGIPYIRVLNLTWGEGMNLDNLVFISEKMNAMIKNSELRPNDILIAKTGATIGKTAIVPESLPISNTTSHVGKITLPNTHCAKYFFYVMTSDIVQKQIQDISGMQSTRPELGIEGMRDLVVVVPPLTTQERIAEYLDERCTKADEILRTKKVQLDVMRKHKASIIYEYVTGKKRVTEVN